MAEQPLAYPAISRRFLPLGKALSKLYPGFGMDLVQAEMQYAPEEYLALLLFYTAVVFVVTSISSFSIMLYMGSFRTQSVFFPFALGLIFALGAYSYFFSYPKVVVGKKTRDVDRVLLYAMRHFLIKVKSGMPMYEAMIGLAQGPYGAISAEFQKTVKQINSGMAEEDVLEKLALRNPSFHFRRTIWQIANSVRAGSDFAPVLESIVGTLAWEQRTAVRKFGSELNTVALMYLMTTIIFPALTVTFLIVLGSFSGVTVPQSIFIMVILGVMGFQFFFLNFIRARRPVFEE